jgi:2-polyprenyl-3-methyl-5-hydroxy-6-metoxy-1,4-benzoquinol methylase
MIEHEHQGSEMLSCIHGNRRDFCKFDNTQLYECLDCFLVFREPVDADRNPSCLYDDFYKNEMSSRFQSPVEYVVRILRLYRALKIYTISRRARTILDIGSGRGFFLYYLKKIFRYKRVVGIQISKPAVEFSRNVLGLEIYDVDFLDLQWEKNTFDVITMWHVLEHVIDPERYIAKIRDVLTPDGCFIMEVPNLTSWTRKITGKYWLGLDLKYHITFFSPESLSLMLERHGFRVTLVHTFSLEYSSFISIQSIISRLTRTNQIFFRWLQGRKYPLTQLVSHCVLVTLLAPICLLINLFLFFTKKGEVLCLVAKKRKD